jgi:serine/threonine protein kinase
MLIDSRKLSVDEVVALGKFLLKASQHLLRDGLVHGDIKPENILVVSDYNSIHFKLIDLGSATEVFSVTSRAGTASYLAPERFHAAPVSERTEIFAIGVTLFQSLTKAFPFGEIERFQTPVFQRAKNPSKLNPNVPPWLASLLLHALSPDPERRYQNYSEMLFDLEHPEKVEPFHHPGATIIDRHPLRFYKIGFYVLLVATLYLLFKIISEGVPLP